MAHNSIESFYRSFLIKPITETEDCPFFAYVNNAPLNWGTQNGFLTLSPNTNNEEICEYDLVDSNTR